MIIGVCCKAISMSVDIFSKKQFLEGYQTLLAIEMPDLGPSSDRTILAAIMNRVFS